MDSLKQTALLLGLVDRLLDYERKPSEAHIQRYTYFMQELLKVPMDFEFILYKDSPYSFDLSDKLTSLRADKLLAIELSNSYPCFITTELGKNFIGRFPKTLDSYKRQIDFAVRYLGPRDIRELGQLATALLIDRTREDRSQDLKSLNKALWVKPSDSVVEQFAEIRSTWQRKENNSLSFS